MSDNSLLMTAMAERCRDMIRAWEAPSLDQPASLQPKYLEWMCGKIATHASEWPASKAHRWIGFIQGAMIANGMIDLDGARRMFDGAKNAYGKADEDLLDHLDPDSSFELDIGGQG